MNIAFFETERWEQEFFERHLPGHTLQFSEDSAALENIPQDTEIISPFIYSQLTEEILSTLPHLKGITTRSTGMDHIDLEYCKGKNIIVKNVPSYGVNTVAEHTFALILALSRHLIPSVERTRKSNFGLESLRGFELAGKTIGIVGLGTIAMRVIELATAFKMKTIVYTRHQDEEKANIMKFSYVDFPTLLSSADIISLHVPATPETHHLINKENIKTLKRGSMIINTARGAIVETEALVWALEQGILTGVGLDVLEEEGALKEERQLLTKEFLTTGDIKVQLLNHVLLHHENVIITPHNAFNSEEALREILEITTKNILGLS